MSQNNPASAHTVIIADDHALVRRGVREVVENIEGVEVVGEAADGLEAITLLKTLQPSLLTLDTGMPLARGMEVFGEARRWAKSTKVAVLTGFTATGLLADWVSAGIDGLFLKTCPPEELEYGLRQILNGEIYYSKAVTQKLSANAKDQLTQREREILHQLAAGYSNKEIGERLHISAKTVDNHRTRMMAKLDVHSFSQLLTYALKEGLLDPETHR